VVLLKIEIKQTPSQQDWLDVKDSTLTTVDLRVKNPPDSKWKMMILKSEHSPIRDLIVKWKWIDIKSWVSVHFVRHHIGINHFVKTSRPDRQKNSTTYNRDMLPQGNKVNHKCSANAQAIINISKDRLCYQASPETRNAWEKFLSQLKDSEPELVSLCVPKCVYRNGLCGEPSCCGYNKTDSFQQRSDQYNKLFQEDLM